MHSQLQFLATSAVVGTGSSSSNRNLRPSVYERPLNINYTSAVAKGAGTGEGAMGANRQSIYGKATPSPSPTDDHLHPVASKGRKASVVAACRRISLIAADAPAPAVVPPVSKPLASSGGPRRNRKGSVTLGAKNNRRRSVADIAAEIGTSEINQKKKISSDLLLLESLGIRPDDPNIRSVAAILCREDWREYPANVSRFFDMARNSLIDQAMRQRLAYGCAEGEVKVDAFGNLEVMTTSTDLLRIVLRDAKRVQIASMKSALPLQYSHKTLQWLAAAKSLLICRQVLLDGDVEAYVAELRTQGYLRKYQMIELGNRPSQREFTLFERFAFEYIAETIIRDAITHVESLTGLDSSVLHHPPLQLLKEVTILPQSMREPTPYYSILQDIAKAFMQAGWSTFDPLLSMN